MRRRPHGFTLLELVVAIAILGLVFLIAGTSLWVIQLTWEKCLARSARIQQRHLIDRFVDSHLRNIVPFEWKNQDGIVRQVFLGERERVIFACHRRLDETTGGLRFVRLSLESGQLIAEYSDLPLLHWDNDWNGVPVRREVIGENIERIEFRYADYEREKGLSWFEDWDPESTRIPLATQMTLYWSNGESEAWLRRAAGAAVRETLGATPFR
jgi:prepilin-type N-terminal cleavage/methylation domain-containing protein